MAVGSPDIFGPGVGFHAGRITPADYPKIDGSFAFVFGSEDEDALGDLAVGDYYEIRQAVDFTALTLLTWQVKFRQPNQPARAAVYRAALVPYPTGFAGGETATIAIDGGGAQVVNFLVGDQSQQDVADRLTASLTGAVASIDPVTGETLVTSLDASSSSEVDVTGGTGLGPIGFSVRSEEGIDPGYKLTVLVGATTVWDITPAKGETVDYLKRTARVEHLAGVQDLIFRVEAVAL